MYEGNVSSEFFLLYVSLPLKYKMILEHWRSFPKGGSTVKTMLAPQNSNVILHVTNAATYPAGCSFSSALIFGQSLVPFAKLCWFSIAFSYLLLAAYCCTYIIFFFWIYGDQTPDVDSFYGHADELVCRQGSLENSSCGSFVYMTLVWCILPSFCASHTSIESWYVVQSLERIACIFLKTCWICSLNGIILPFFGKS